MNGPDRRERQNSFLEPLELEELDSQHNATGDDPDVFDRVTAVPGDLPDHDAPTTRPPATPEDEDISGLFQRASETDPPDAPPDSDPPPVLSAPGSGGKRTARRGSLPARGPSRPASERPARRSSPPRQPAIELDFDLVSSEPEPIPERRPDALEVELPVAHPTGHGGTLGPPSPSNSPDVVEMKDRYATGDFSGALVVAEGILEENPYHEEAQRCRERCTDVLSQMYLARLGSLAQVVSVGLSGDQIRWLSLDHRAGFLLSLIDGQSTIEMLLDISGMSRLEALRILFGLLDQRVITLSDEL